MNMLHSLRAVGLVVIVVGGLAACSDNSVSPIDAEVTNATDNFQFQATAVTGVTVTQSYSWSNTGTRATINHSTTTTAGSVQLTVRDAAGNVVYGKALVPSLNEPTAVGTAGTWTVVLTMTNYSGTVNFRVQKL